VLVVRGPNVFPGYLGEGQTPFTEDGWLITGDVGSVCPDGLVRVTGRVKDVIIRGGHNIDPIVIEDAANNHCDVVTSAAVGRPDVYAGEIPMLYVVLRDGSTGTLADLRAHLERSVMEPPACPKSIVAFASLPMTPIGKIDKLARRRDAAIRVTRETLEASSPLHGAIVDITAQDGPGGRTIVAVTLARRTEAAVDLAAIVDHLLAGFLFV
jgi:fatty-acyl-CoA synthase